MKGLAFPLTVVPRTASRPELIRASLLTILGTEKGERLFDPEFGVRVRSYLFEPQSDTLFELVRTDVMGALGAYEPRIAVVAVDPSWVEELEQRYLKVDITYVDRETRESSSLYLEYPA